MAQEKKIRVQLDMDEKSVSTLDSTKEKLSFASRAETVRRELFLLWWYVKMQRKGAKMYIKRPNGERERIVFPELET